MADGTFPESGTDSIAVQRPAYPFWQGRITRGVRARAATHASRTCGDGDAGEAAEVAGDARPLVAGAAGERSARPRRWTGSPGRATGASARAASGRTARQLACAWWPPRASGRCRLRCTAARALTSAASSARSNSPQRTMRSPSSRASVRASVATRLAASASEGPDVMTTCTGCGMRGERRGQLREALGRPAPERVSGADVQHGQPRVGGHAGIATPFVDPSDRRRDRAASHRIAVRRRRARCREGQAGPID